MRAHLKFEIIFLSIILVNISKPCSLSVKHEIFHLEMLCHSSQGSLSHRVIEWHVQSMVMAKLEHGNGIFKRNLM